MSLKDVTPVVDELLKQFIVLAQGIIDSATPQQVPAEQIAVGQTDQSEALQPAQPAPGAACPRLRTSRIAASKG